jgi:hypothetical protein
MTVPSRDSFTGNRKERPAWDMYLGQLQGKECASRWCERNESPMGGACVAFGYDARTRRFLLRFGRGSRVGGHETCSRLAQGSQFSGPHSLEVT